MTHSLLNSAQKSAKRTSRIVEALQHRMNQTSHVTLAGIDVRRQVNDLADALQFIQSTLGSIDELVSAVGPLPMFSQATKRLEGIFDLTDEDLRIARQASNPGISPKDGSHTKIDFIEQPVAGAAINDLLESLFGGAIKAAPSQPKTEAPVDPVAKAVEELKAAALKFDPHAQVDLPSASEHPPEIQALIKEIEAQTGGKVIAVGRIQR